MILILKIVLTLVVFFYCHQLGVRHRNAENNGVPCNPKLPESNLPSPALRSGATGSQRRLSAVDPANAVSVPYCEDGPEQPSGVYDHCTISPYDMNRTFLHLAPGTIPEDIFPNLHHPGTPAKFSFVFTQGMEWEKEKPVQKMCNEIYLTRTGSRLSQPNKCVAVAKVPEGVASYVQQSHRWGYTALLTNQYRDDYPREDTFDEELELLPPLIKRLPELLGEFKQKMGEPIAADGTRRAVIIMVANEGVMDLLLNFICSAEDAGIDIKSIMVFVGTANDVALVRNMGAQAMYHTALGGMPAKAAGMYLDNTFSRMMWYKTTSVSLALMAGFDVLFQDVDLVWMRDPIPYMKSLNADIAFMDDGARTPRYTPFFVNSGFYYVRNNNITRYFQEKMLKSGPCEIGRTHSHQSVLIRHLSESHHLWGLKVAVLDRELFPSGEAYHERKKFLNTVIDRTFAPFVFHMCWTDNKANKIEYFKNSKLWYLPEKTDDKMCSDGKELNGYVREQLQFPDKVNQIPVRNRCCQRDRYWGLPANSSALVYMKRSKEAAQKATDEIKKKYGK